MALPNSPGLRRTASGPPHRAASPTVRFSPGRAAVGAVLALVGAASLAAQVALLNCGTTACDRAIVTIGLAWGSAISALSQLALIAGLWLFWSARYRDR